MSVTLLRHLRLAVAACVLTGLSIVSFGLGAEPLPAQIMEPCAFDDGSDEWACAAGPHVYEGSCEGVDCYTMMEWCCIPVP